MGCCKQRYYFFHDAPPICAPDMTTSCGKLLCAPVVVGKRFSFAGRNLCALRKARRAPLHPIGEYALLSPHAPTADCRERAALSKRLTRSGGLSAQTAHAFVRRFRVFRLSLARAIQVFFVFCLHRFTHPLQRYDCQHVWCEGFLFFPFTLCITSPPSFDSRKRFAFQRDCFQKPGSTEQKRPMVKVKIRSLHPEPTLGQPIARIR